LRGGKYSAFDGGTRVPFIVHWPERVKTGVSDALVCQIDFMASLASLTSRKLAFDDAPDSINVLEALLGETQDGRKHLVEHAGVLSLIKGRWKFIAPSRGSKINASTGIEMGRDPKPQLYDLKNDIGEKNNIAAEHSDIVEEMSALLKKIKKDGRTRP
jgi:arylsulfatase A-like enzyme